MTWSSCVTRTTSSPGSSTRRMPSGSSRSFASGSRSSVGTAPRQDAPHRVRALRGQRRAKRGRRQARDVRLPRLHAHVRKTRDGRFWLKRKTISKRMRAKLAEVKDQLMRRRHQPIPEQGRWLASVVRGHLAYYAVPGNTDAVAAFRDQVRRLWYQALRRRSQRTRINWDRRAASHRWLPPARIMHPYPEVRFDARTQGRAQCGSPARWDLRGGPPARAVPTAIKE